MLFDRGKPTSLGTDYGGSPTGSLQFLLWENPLSEHYRCPERASNQEVVSYLLAKQKKRFGTTILIDIAEEEKAGLSMQALTNHARLLRKRYTLDIVYRAIDLGIVLAHHPFSFRFIEQVAIPRLEKECPFLIFR